MIFRLTDNKIIESFYSYSMLRDITVAILEDLFESQPVREIEQIFFILENQIATHKTVTLSLVLRLI